MIDVTIGNDDAAVTYDADPYDSLAELLLIDRQRRLETKYAELGIPMFLVGHDASHNAERRRQDLIDPLGARLARLASILALRKPAIDRDDIGLLLELMAERYFMPGPSTDAVIDHRYEPAIDDLWIPAKSPPVLAELVDGMARGRAFRQLNFHATPRYRASEFRNQLARYAATFEPITPDNYASAVDGSWSHPRPGMLVALYEGYRDNYDVILPILEEFGLTGWFFVPSAFLGVAPREQRRFAAEHDLFLPEIDEYPDDRIAMSWAEAADVAARGHVFVCHTRTHHEVTATTAPDILTNEIVIAKREIDRGAASDVRHFCWLEGAALGVNPQADAMLRAVGFDYLISNFQVQKL